MKIKVTLLVVLMAGAALVAAEGPAFAETSAETVLGTVQELEGKTDAQSLVRLARLLIAGIPVSDENPLRIADYSRARAALEAAAQITGSSQGAARVLLAKMLLKGQGGTVDRTRAIDLLENSAAAGNGEAAFLLGEEYRTAEGRAADAKSYYQSALRLGYAEAGLVLSDLNAADDPDAADDVRFLATSLLEAQAADGRASAAMALGNDIIKSGDPFALSRAFGWFERAAELGDNEGLLAAARLEADPASTLYNPAEAGRLYLRAADAGSLDATLAILIDHDKANDLGISDEDTEHWAKLVLETGDVGAILTYASLNSVSDERRREIADNLFDRLSEHSVDVTGMLSLGARLVSGDVVPRDVNRALALFRRASALGSDDASLRVGETLLREPSLQQSNDVRDAIRLVRSVADKGNPEAEVLMGDFYLRGFGTAADPDVAAEWYVKAADHNSAEGMTSLAQLYLGSSDHESRQQALPWLIRAAGLGNMESQLELADAYVRGDIVDRDVFKAIEAYQVAVAGNAPGALDALAKVYLRIGGAGAIAEAQGVYEDAIAHGYPEADVKYGAFLVETGRAGEAVKYLDRKENASNMEVALLLQSIYFQGLAGAIDKDAGRRWLDRALALSNSNPSQLTALASALIASGETDYVGRGVAFLTGLDRQGDAEASRLLAKTYLNGIGVERDVDRALDLFDRAIDAGSIAAEVDLGDAYLNGNGVSKQTDRAVALFEDVVTKEPDNLVANLRLGNILANGIGGARDTARAAQYYEAAADTGSTSAQRAIGLQYLWGDGVQQDAGQAEYWLRTAAVNGAGNAYRDLAMLKSAGIASGITPDAAFAYNLEAANRADVTAMIEVGIALVQGFGVPADPIAGATWLKRASDMGSDIAMYDLYLMYSSGYGLPQDREQADRWLTAAANAGNGSALYRQALALLDEDTESAKEDAIALLQKAVSAKHNQSKKLLVKMGVLSPSEADDVDYAGDQGEGDGNED